MVPSISIQVSEVNYRALVQLGIPHKLIEKDAETAEIPLPDFWTIPEVNYRGKTLTADLSKKLLPPRTQQQHAEHRNSAGKNEFVSADMPFYFSMYRALFEQRDKLEIAEEARDFIQRAMRQRFLSTLTRPAYSPRGKDRVIHNYGTNDRYDIKANIVGPDGLIKSRDKGTLNALLGTGDVRIINNVYNWLNVTNASIYRFNEKPQELTEVVARFVANPGDARLDCNGRPDFVDPSLGVRINARSAPSTKK